MTQSSPVSLPLTIEVDTACPTTNEIYVSKMLESLAKLIQESEFKWKSKLQIDNTLTRSLVSFQANKKRAAYRWFKYKEGFSADLIEYFFSRFKISSGVLLDPFAGSGTTLFAAGEMGIQSEGIELLPIGQTLIATKQLINWELTDSDITRLEFWKNHQPWKLAAHREPVHEFKITQGAYPTDTLDAMGRFLMPLNKKRRPFKRYCFLLFCAF